MEMISKAIVDGSLASLVEKEREAIEQETRELPKQAMNRFQRRAIAALERKNKKLTAKINQLEKLNK